ncbi:MAG: sulfatase-like hydrolase/transferase [Bacteroidales bacterium]|nr:sulfatase-like hydrolase/transferase [Bacteroidales bacterium]
MANFKNLKPVLILLSCLFLGLLSCNNNSGDSKTNFLVLISDDQRWDQVSYTGNQVVPEFTTPNLDKLASQGIYFTNAFVTTPICAVSRACIMTGRYSSSHGMNHFNTPLKEDVIEKTYPALLKEAGYRTGVLGKWGIGMDGTEEIFDVCEAWHHQGVYYHKTDSGIIHNSEWLAAKSREFLKSCKADQPFCLIVCFKSPHHPYQPDFRDTSLFKNTVIPKRESDTPEAYSSLASHIMEGSLNRWCYFDERKDEETKNDFEKNFLRCVKSLDRAVGKILGYLNEFNLEDNTTIIFLSDHGYLWGEHGLGGKWLLYEESIRTPMIIKWPGMDDNNQGKLLNQMVLNIDIAPTILDIAGLEVPEIINGRSIVPLLKNPKSTFRDDFFMEHVGIVNAENPIPDSYGIRSKEWKYIQYVNADPDVEELYNLKDDPLELNNLANNPAFSKEKQYFNKRYKNYIEQLKKNK